MRGTNWPVDEGGGTNWSDSWYGGTEGRGGTNWSVGEGVLGRSRITFVMVFPAPVEQAEFIVFRRRTRRAPGARIQHTCCCCICIAFLGRQMNFVVRGGHLHVCFGR